MKQRLIEATLDALVEVGYADLTFSHVVERAGVSRGAPLHHFASKAALVEAAAEVLVGEMSERVARTWRTAKSSPDPFRTFCLSLWRDFFTTPQGAMMAELNHASRHSAELAPIVSRLWTEAYQAANELSHQDEKLDSDDANTLPVSIGRMLMMSHWFMSGMAADIHHGAPEGLFEAYLDSWVEMLRMQRN